MWKERRAGLAFQRGIPIHVPDYVGWAHASAFAMTRNVRAAQVAPALEAARLYTHAQRQIDDRPSPGDKLTSRPHSEPASLLAA